MLNVTHTYPSENATWRDALALAAQASERCACGLDAIVMVHVGEEGAQVFACVDCANRIDPTGTNFYLPTADGFEPWENVLDFA